MDFHTLEKMTATELRDMAGKYEDVDGVSGMKKEQLLDILCQKLGIDRHQHLPTGIGRRDLKRKIRVLRQRRDEALSRQDASALKSARRQMKSTRRRLRRVILQALRKAPPAASQG